MREQCERKQGGEIDRGEQPPHWDLNAITRGPKAVGRGGGEEPR